MSFPSKNDILIGICFLFVGVIYTLSDRWMLMVKVSGVRDDYNHIFDHFFIMWALKQLLQLQLFILSMAIENNWLGFARFRHGDLVPRANPSGRVLQIPNDNHALVINNEDEIHDGNGHLPDEPSSDNDVYAIAHPQNVPINGDTDEENEGYQDGNGDEKEQLLQHLGGDNPQKARRIKKPPFMIYLPPAIFAQAHVLLLYFGLKLTYGSSFIMLKGTVAFFTALLSMAFLAQQLACYVWFGVVVATLGFAVSGISDYIHIPSGGYEKYGIAAGNLLIVMAQIMFAAKIIYEEKFIRKHTIHPMKFVGCEAIYGTFIAVVFLLVFNFVDAEQYSSLPNMKLEDIKDAAYQFYHSWRVKLAVIGSLVCYILYTYLGLFLVRDQGALARIMIETLVWGIFWSLCLALQWEHFFIAQVPGLCIIAIGVLIYSHILVLPFFSRLEGIDHKGDGFTDQFMDLDRPDNIANLGRHDQEQVDDNILPEGSDGARYQHQEDDNLLNREIVVELHQHEANNENPRENVFRTDSIDERLIQA